MHFFRHTSQQKEILSTETTPISRRTLFRRLGTGVVTTALVAGPHMFFPSIVSAAQAKTGQKGLTMNSSDTTNSLTVNIVLVHGAFADASSWNQVIIRLQQAGYNVLAVQLPLTSLAEDIAVTRAALATISGSIVLAGHSYGGAVISGAATGVSNVVSLVYASAYAPAEGETLLDLNGRYPATEATQYLRPSYLQGSVWIEPDAFPKVFVADIDPAHARALSVVQKPIFGPCFTDKAGVPAWQTLPSWYIVSENDKTINPDLEQWMAARMKANTRSIPSSHASPVSHPEAVADAIFAAANSVKKA